MNPTTSAILPLMTMEVLRVSVERSVTPFTPAKDDYYHHRGERAYMYCPPWSCLVHAALFLCREVKSITGDIISIRVRPDDRLTGSCCYKESIRIAGSNCREV